MFDLSTFPGIFIRENQKGDAKIWFDDIHKVWILEHSGESWMGLNTFNNYQLKQFYGAYDLAYGDVLCTGLGFGLLPVWLTNKPSVKSVTVIEKSYEVIDMFMEANPFNAKLNIKCGDATTFATDQKFDCIFFDHYEIQDWSKSISEAKQISANVPNHDLSWMWALEHFYVEDYYQTSKLSPRIFKDFSERYDDYRTNVGKGIKFPNLTKDKINEYIYTYHNILQFGNIVLDPKDNNFRQSWAIDNN